MGRFTPRLDILPPAQRDIWPQLAPSRDLGFVLYGGTAIALRLGHRLSVDFDFFSDRPVDKDALVTVFDFLKHGTVLQDQPDSFTFLVPAKNDARQAVKLSFFGRLSMGRVSEPDFTIDNVIQVASLDDLMATKLKVVLQRIESRDYVDIATMLLAGVSLERGLAAARAMYGKAFQPSESLKALVYFKGGDLPTLEAGQKAILMNAVKAVRMLPQVQVASGVLAASEE
jgi:Nucleotidyl transferase AbiEii toxin, Type IV TA system